MNDNFIRSNSIKRNATDIFGTLPSDGQIDKVNKIVIPTVQIAPYIDVVRGGTGAGTVYTTPTNKDFYLTALTLSFVKDVTAVATYVNIYTTIGGVASVIMAIPSTTLTVDSAQLSLSLPVAIKVDRGAAITIGASSATANITARASIIGYTVDNITA